jgi:uncharacterized membrane protein
MDATRAHLSDAEQEQQVLQVELAVAKLLRVGTAISTALTGLGLAILLLHLPLSIGPALITAGLITLVCTPLLRVAAALLIYLKLGDRTYAIISLIVLCVVSLGIMLGQVH